MRFPRLLALLLLAAAPASAAVEFDQLAPGSWLAGRQTLSVATDLARVDRVEIRVDGVLIAVLRSSPFAFEHDFGDGSRPHLLRADVHAGGYTIHEATELTVGAASHEEAMTVDWVEVPLALSRPPRDAESLRLFENGRPVHIRSIEPGRGPTRFVFVIDRSQSMAGGRLEAALDAVRSISRRLSAGDTAEVLAFNHRVGRPMALSDAIEESPSGGTALRDALSAIEPDSRTVAIVISDGDDRNSFLDRDEALRRIAIDRLSVYSLVLGRGNAKPFLAELAERTGGRMLSSTPSRLTRDLGRLFDEIEARWIVSYQSAASDRGWRSIRVEPSERGLRVLEARTGYYAP
ncbi:MAG: VWA domain-containing protein [Thermoanaerobaculia bacterium]